MKEIITKWYNTVFPDGKYKDEFFALLESTELCDTKYEDYKTGDGQKDLLMTLYYCEMLEKRFDELGVPKEILLDTVSDIALWTNVYVGLFGRLGLSEPDWFRYAHFTGNFFKLGRLQFLVNENETEVHIPACGPFPPEMCDDSFKKADEFIKKFYPERANNPYVCHSWLLDDTLKKFLGPETNIMKFASRFTPFKSEESDAALRFAFRWNTTRENLADTPAVTSLQKKLKEYALAGGKFYETFGKIEK